MLRHSPLTRTASQRFLIDMFDATVEFDGPEYPGGPRMTVINIGPAH